MIKISELRIGNLIQFNGPIQKLGGKPDAPFAITHMFMRQCCIVGEEVSDWEPIRLTPDWLEMAGFKDLDGKQNGGKGHQLKIPFFQNTRLKTVYYNGGMVDVFPCIGEDLESIGQGCHYVHELQNLYYVLTKSELKIKYTSPK